MMKKYMMILLVIGYPFLMTEAQTKHLDKLPQKQRDSILVPLAKEIILKYGPDFYDEYQSPVIRRNIASKEKYIMDAKKRGIRASHGRKKIFQL